MSCGLPQRDEARERDHDGVAARGPDGRGLTKAAADTASAPVIHGKTSGARMPFRIRSARQTPAMATVNASASHPSRSLFWLKLCSKARVVAQR
jgi:hypothetical protein